MALRMEQAILPSMLGALRDGGKLIRSMAFSFTLLLSPACTEFSGEATVIQCSDSLDNDNDLLVDCMDPDCIATSVCGLLSSVDNPEPGPASPGTVAEATPAAVVDAATGELERPDSQAAVDMDAGMVHVPLDDRDAMVDEPATEELPPEDPCNAQCSEEERCVAGQCKPRNIHRYLLRLRGAETPRHRTLLDTYDSGLTLVGPWYLNSVQDLYATVVVNGVEAARTATVQNQLSPTWMPSEFDLEVTESDVIEVVLWDYDGELNNADLVFRCEAPLLVLPAAPTEDFQPLGCRQTTIDGRLFAIDGDALMLY